MRSFELNVNFTMECAHYLPNVPEGHKCGRMHGHSYKVMITAVSIEEDEICLKKGWFADSGDIKEKTEVVRKKLDHTCLNEVIRNPTAEYLAVWIADELEFPLASIGVQVQAVTIYETENTNVVYTVRS